MRLLLRLSILPFAVLVSAASPVATPSPSPSPTPLVLIGISSIVSEADKDIAALGEIQDTLGSDGLSENLAKVLPKLKQDIDSSLVETNRILATPAKIGVIQQQGTRWSLLRDDAALWSGLINEKLARLDHESARVGQMTTLWKASGAAAGAASAPADLMARVASVVKQAGAAEDAIDAKRTELLKYQGRLADQSARINQILAALARARGEAVDRLLERDSPPLWAALKAAAPAPAAPREDLFRQLRSVGEFLQRERGKLVLSLAIWAFLVFAFRRARNYVRKWTEADPGLRESTAIFDVPVSTASFLSLWLGYALYPDAPGLFFTLLGAALIIPLFLILHRLVERPLLPITWALAACYLAYQIREAAAGIPLLSRLIYLVEVLGGILFVLWLIYISRFAEKPEKGRRLLWRVVGAAARLSLAIFVVAGIANVVGYVNLSLFIGAVFLQCAFLALLLYASCHILGGLVAFAFKIPPLSLLTMVRHHRPVLERRIVRLIRAAAAVLWVFFALDQMSLLGETLSAFSTFLALPIVAEVTVGGVVAFLLTVWASFLLSQFIRFLLEEDVYRRVHLKPGLPFAISTLLHYAILLLGFYLAMAALLGDISKFTVLAGAFGVGLAFGLQTIVNNFVSSLIVLFERPIKIGDHIEIGTLQGTVRQIGIRATVIRTPQGSEIIIPNAKLISDPVTNWTHTNHQRLVEIDIVTANAGVDPRKVIILLEAAAAARPEVSSIPPPEAVLSKFAAASLSFELRVWTSDLPNAGRLRSELTVSVNEALAAGEIALA
jgi:potassium efflux system protein